MDRIPFQEAIEDDNLLKIAFEDLSFPQQVTLKAMYGCPLSATRINPNTGWDELDYWAIVQGSCDYDELGFVTKVHNIPYTPKEYNQLWAVVGRRAGKTSSLMAFIIAYEATLGGHDEYVKPGQENTIYLIAQRMSLAQASLAFIRYILNTSPLLAREMVDGPATELNLRNGIKIVPSPPSLKAQRGMAVPVVGMDEVGFWYTDPDAANPDIEVEAAVRYAQLQFAPFDKRVGISTPWAKEGLLYKYYQAGTEGIKLKDIHARAQYKGALFVFATTAAFENPKITREALERIRLEDPDNFGRESLCQFLDSISGFLSSKLVEYAANKAAGTAERAPVDRKEKVQPIYVAAMDPAFRYDSFAFAIVHKSSTEGVITDVLRRWTPIRGHKLNPREVLAEIAVLCKQYDIAQVWSDQYQLESLQQLAYDFGISINGMDFTASSKAKIYGSLQQLFNQSKITLLDPNLNDAARALVSELITLERRTTGGGRVQIAAPEGKHDDMASVLALASHHALYLDPVVEAETAEREPTLLERGLECIRRKNTLQEDY